MKLDTRYASATFMICLLIMSSFARAHSNPVTASNTRARAAVLPHAPPKKVEEQKIAGQEKKSAISDTELKELEAFSRKELDEKKDYPQVVKSIKILLALDHEDPSRTTVMDFSNSYNKYKKIYDKAFKTLETPKNKQQLQEIKQLMANAQDGNG